jgi:hypothetical protein
MESVGEASVRRLRATGLLITFDVSPVERALPPDWIFGVDPARPNGATVLAWRARLVSARTISVARGSTLSHMTDVSIASLGDHA